MYFAKLVQAIAKGQNRSVEDVANEAGLDAANLRRQMREDGPLNERTLMKALAVLHWDERRLLSSEALAYLTGNCEPETQQLMSRLAELEQIIATVREVVKVKPTLGDPEQGPVE